MTKFALVALALLLAGCQARDASPAATPPRVQPSPVASSTSLAGEGGMMVGALQPDVQLDKEVYAPGEEIRVTVIATGADSGFVTQESASRDDPSPSATPHAVSDNAMPILRAGSPGKYEVRLYLSENSPNPAAVRAYEVKSP